MSLNDLAFAAIAELAPLVAKKKVSPVELAEMLLRRIELLNPQLNAYLTVTSEQALAQAREAEKEILKGRRRGPLHGARVRRDESDAHRLPLRTGARSARPTPARHLTGRSSNRSGREILKKDWRDAGECGMWENKEAIRSVQGIPSIQQSESRVQEN